MVPVVPVVSSLQRFPCTGLLLWSQWCPHYRGFPVQNCYCGPSGVPIIEVPLYRTVTVVPVVSSLQRFPCTELLLWSRWCPQHRGSTVHCTRTCQLHTYVGSTKIPRKSDFFSKSFSGIGQFTKSKHATTNVFAQHTHSARVNIYFARMCIKYP